PGRSGAGVLTVEQGLVPHRRCRPAGHETRGEVIRWHRAAGDEVGVILVHLSPSVSRTRDSRAPLSAPWAEDGPGARFLEFFEGGSQAGGAGGGDPWKCCIRIAPASM